MNVTLETRARKPRNTGTRARIGEILLATGALARADIERILAAQRTSGKLFGQIAIEMKLVTDGELREALARQFEYPIANPAASTLGPSLAAAYDPFSAYAESLRTLRSQLLVHWFGKQEATLAVIAARAGEGTSTLAANLGIVFAQLGERTLIVDANLRKPTQHLLFGLGSGDGLSDLLNGRCRIEHAVRKVSHFECLHVLGAGSVPPNPQELLTRLPFTHLLDELSDRFDVMILDTPPLLAYADAHIIATRARGCLIATRRHQTRLADVARVKRQLDTSVPHILGAVLTG